MRIENIHVDGFGVWNDKTLGPLEPQLNVFVGPNETGKSTLMAFIRSMLFGFEKRVTGPLSRATGLSSRARRGILPVFPWSGVPIHPSQG